MEPYEPHLSLLAALAVGMLIGLEREQVKDQTKGGGFAGIRTYPIFALVGALSTLLAPASMWLPLVSLAGVVTLLAIAYAGDIRKDRDQGMTTEASVLATYLLGALATSRGVLEPMSTRLLLVVALGVVLTFLLSSKQRLHGFAARVSRDDLYATIKFLIVAVIVLPLLPDRAMGPLDAINPFSVGLMVVLISGLSFVGYVAITLLGPGRGLLLSAAIGGLVSSTAVTISFSTRTKSEPKLAPIAAAAIAIASTIMVARIGVLVSVVNPHLLAVLALPLVGAASGGVLGSILVYRRGAHGATDGIELKNPFELGNALRFGLIFAAIAFATRAAKYYFGSEGLYIASAIGGTTDVDAVSLSAAKQAGSELVEATIAIAIAMAVNTLVKSSIGLVIGGRGLGVRSFIVGALMIAGLVVGLVPAAF